LALANAAALGADIIQPGWLDQSAFNVAQCVLGLGPPSNVVVAQLSSFVPLIFAGTNSSNWLPSLQAASPPARQFPAYTYDAGNQTIVLFGGLGANGSLLNDTWIWNGASWLQESPSQAPPSNAYLAMAYDPGRKMVVLVASDGTVTTTWLWDGTNWAPSKAASPPGGVYGMAYDGNHKQIVLFGLASNTNTVQTWLWDGTKWTQAFPVTSPPVRVHQSMAYDEAMRNVMIFGGTCVGCDPGVLGDTWSWDGTTWSMASASGPQARAGAGMTYDTVQSQMLLFGGVNGDGSVTYDDTWAWDGTSWAPVVPPSVPPARSYFAMAYDSASAQLVIFGGAGSIYLSDTWIWGTFNSVDAAIAEVQPNAVEVSDVILGIGTIASETLSPTLGQAVQKSGRTTGVTTGGVITGIDVRASVPYSGRVAHFVNQIAISGQSFAAGGDTGSLILEDVPNNPRAVGLLFAGGTTTWFANPIQDVLAVFPGSTMVGQDTAPSSAAPSSQDTRRLQLVRGVKARHEDLMLSLPGVVATGIGLSSTVPGELVIQLYVSRITEALRRAAPTALEGISIETVETGEIAPL
jgi:hypothetical protein